MKLVFKGFDFMETIFERFVSKQTQEEQKLLKSCPEYREAIKETCRYNQFALKESVKDVFKVLVRR